MNYLDEGLKSLGFEKGDFSGIKTTAFSLLKQKLDLYVNLLLEYNAKFDLINTADYDQTVIRQILDSLSASQKLAELASKMAKEKNACSQTENSVELSQLAEKIASIDGKSPDETSLSIADIGSGAGLPGIALASAFPTLNFTLVERMSKRCAFLAVCAE